MAPGELIVETTPISELGEWLPDWLGGLSIARGQIVVDQIRGCLERTQSLEGNQGDDVQENSPLIWLTASDSQGRRESILAIQSFSSSEGRLGDTATILHAGPVGISRDSPFSDLLLQQFHQLLRDRGVLFLQWATDVDASQNAAIHEGCQSLGLQPLATLEYLSAGQADILSARSLPFHSVEAPPLYPPSGRVGLSGPGRACDQSRVKGALPGRSRVRPSPREGDVDRKERKVFDTRGQENLTAPQRKIPAVSLTPVAMDDPAAYENFVALVQRTYLDTQDCPALSEFRSAGQTLAAYQNVDSFDPKRWYTISLNEGEESQDRQPAIGCLLMASHGLTTTELVYMALDPAHRGKGLGRALVALAMNEGISRNPDADQPQRIVLAVDQQNAAARYLYHEVGLRPLMQETVWGKAVAPNSDR